MEQKSDKQVEFKYLGDSHYIDINTLLVSQFHFAAIVNEIKAQIFPDINLNIKVRSFEKGSFDINQLFQISTVSALFALENINYVSTLLTILSDYVSIKKFLKSEKADKVIPAGDKIEIHLNVNGDNNTITVHPDAFKIYQNNDVVSEALKQEAKILESDDEITGFEIREDKEKDPIVNVPREDFHYLSMKNPYLDEEEKEKVKQVSLGIFKWETIPKKGSRWSFIYENRKINQVIIRDEKFLRRIVDEKLRFGAGDSLLVDLLIKLKKDEYSGMYLEDKFEVLEVHHINWRGEQTSMF